MLRMVLLSQFLFPFRPKGRAGRAMFWSYSSLAFGTAAACLSVGGSFWPEHLFFSLMLPPDAVDTTALSLGLLAFPLLLFWPLVAAHRLQDGGHPRHWLLLLVLPVLGWILLAILFSMPPDRRRNEYGVPPGEEEPVPILPPLVRVSSDELRDLRRARGQRGY